MNRALPRYIRYSRRPHPIRALAAPLGLDEDAPVVLDAEPDWLKDLRLFATGWLAGLVFFGTLLA